MGPVHDENDHKETWCESNMCSRQPVSRISCLNRPLHVFQGCLHAEVSRKATFKPTKPNNLTHVRSVQLSEGGHAVLLASSTSD